MSEAPIVRYLSQDKNVLGTKLEPCSTDPLTGYFRDGTCRTGIQDDGSHILCSRLTDEFLLYSKDQGNDLISPSEDGRFKGLKSGDQWCLCISRWTEALQAGAAPAVVLESTHRDVLQWVPIDSLLDNSVKQQ